MDLEQILSKMQSGETPLSEVEKRTLFKAMGGNDKLAMDLRRDFAASRAEVVKPLIAQQSLVRTIYRETTSDDGSPIKFPVRSKRVRAAWFAANIGAIPQRTAEIDEISFPTFPITAGARWSIDLYRTGAYDLVSDLEMDAVDDVGYKENLAGFSLINAAFASGDGVNISKLSAETGLTVNVLIEMMTKMDQQGEDRRRLTDLYLSVRRYNELLKWATLDVQELADGVREEIFSGGPDSISTMLKGWNLVIHKVYDPEFVDDTFCYGFDRRRFGWMPTDLQWETVQDAQAVMTFEDGWIGRKSVGFGITDTPSMCKYSFA